MNADNQNLVINESLYRYAHNLVQQFAYNTGLFSQGLKADLVHIYVWLHVISTQHSGIECAWHYMYSADKY